MVKYATYMAKALSLLYNTDEKARIELV